MKTHTARAGVLVTVTSLVLLGAGVTTAQATKPAPTHKVTLCHRTASAAGGNQHNGYDIITVDIASVANAKDVRGHDSHEQQGNGPGGDIIPSFTYGDFTYPGKNLGGGGQAFLDRGCHAPIVVPVRPEPVVVVTAKDKIDCDAKVVTTTTVTKTTDWILKNNKWVKDSPVVTQEVTTRDATAQECPVVVPVKPEPVVVVTHSDATDCDASEVTTTTVTTTTGWVLEANKWVRGEPVVTQEVTTRDATAQECPVVAPPVMPEPVVVVTHSDATDCDARQVRTTTVTTTTGWIMAGDGWVKDSPVVTTKVTKRDTTAKECPVVPPVAVLGVEAVAPAPAPAAAPAAANPLPAAAAAGAADTSGQLVAGGLVGMAAFLMLGAGTALRRRRGEV